MYVEVYQFYHENLLDTSFTAHLRLRPRDSGKPRTLYPPTSAIGNWQIEPEAGLISGNYGLVKSGAAAVSCFETNGRIVKGQL